MKKASIWLTLLAACLALAPAAASAQDNNEMLGSVGFNLHGYYRARWFNYFNPGWLTPNAADKSNYWEFLDQRLVLLPTLTISDPIKVVMEANILDNVQWGDNTVTQTPAVQTTRPPSNPSAVSAVNATTINFFNGSVFSHMMSDTSTSGTDVNPFEIRQLYAQLTLPIGWFRIGRQGANWGMGIQDNSGSPYSRFLEKQGDVSDRNSGFDNNGGDNYDRILFASRIADFYYPMLYYDRIADGDFKTGTDDVNALTFANQFRDIHFADTGQFDGGFFIRMREQIASRASLWFYDAWGRLQYCGFLWEVEGVAYQGRATFFSDHDVATIRSYGYPVGQGGGVVHIEAYNVAGRFKYDAGRWGAGLETGFSTPSAANPNDEYSQTAQNVVVAAKQALGLDPQNPTAKTAFTNAVVMNQQAFGRRISTVAFNPEYKIDLIGWDQLMGGALVNGVFFKAGGYVHPLDGMLVRLDEIDSYVNQPDIDRNGRASSRGVGWETDLNYAYTFYKQFTLDLKLGYMLPGQYFRDNFLQVRNVFSWQFRTIVNF